MSEQLEGQDQQKSRMSREDHVEALNNTLECGMAEDLSVLLRDTSFHRVAALTAASLGITTEEYYRQAARGMAAANEEMLKGICRINRGLYQSWDSGSSYADFERSSAPTESPGEAP